MKRMNQAWQKWKQLARNAGIFQSKALLTLTYFTIFLPYGVLGVLLLRNSSSKSNRNTNWVKHDHLPQDIPRLKQQY